jgi:hypothetical protein
MVDDHILMMEVEPTLDEAGRLAGQFFLEQSPELPLPQRVAQGRGQTIV